MDKRFLEFHKMTFMMLTIFVSIILFCIIGCNREARYKVLSFFFEGVPEPGAKKSSWGSDANVVSMTNVQMLNLERANDRTVSIEELGQNLASRHDFARDCAQCHMGSLGTGMLELRSSLPDLCYSCHSDLHQEGDYLHGPLNVGECVFCHDPHQSKYIHLQKVSQPDLCYLCHQKEDVALIPGHQKAIEGICTDCHDPHASPVPKLLKVGRVQQDDPNTVN